MGEAQYEKAYESLRHRLISQSVKPGQRLTEQALADEIGVNRGDVRQAFSRLLAEGLVVRGARGGVFARTYTSAYLREMAEVRMALETAAAALAIDRADEHDLTALREVVTHMALMAEHGYEMGLNEADLRFHELLVKAAHNDRFYHLYRLANVPLTFRIVEERRREGASGEQEDDADTVRLWMKKDARDHRAILEALERRDKETLVRLLIAGMTGNP
jgi:DNA-binding GntR family transcriptional regulator